jgi:hypothetical protein
MLPPQPFTRYRKMIKMIIHQIQFVVLLLE